MTDNEPQQIEEHNNESVGKLIRQLQQFDNPKGYRLEYDAVNEKLGHIVAQLAQKGEAALDQLHELLQYEESWSCLFALETLKGIKSEKSIPCLIEFIKRNENGNYFESCDEAIWALQAIGEPAIGPLMAELKKGFTNEDFSGYLVEALTEIKDERIYSFLTEITEDYLKNPEKYKDWFEIDMFTCGFADQGKKEALPLLRQVLEAVSNEERLEIENTMERLDDPEGYDKRISEMAELYSGKTKHKSKLGRNDPCHCGSGTKYKKCCLTKDVKKTG